MKALVLKAYKQFAVEDVPEPKIGAGDVLVAVKACGICGSDVHGMDGSTGRRRPPIIMGHEAAGVIAKAGEKAGGWKPGDRVTFDSTIYCGQCDFCRAGRINLCGRRRVERATSDEPRAASHDLPDRGFLPFSLGSPLVARRSRLVARRSRLFGGGAARGGVQADHRGRCHARQA